MTPEITCLSDCLCCGSSNLSLVLDLGLQPLANTLLISPTDKYNKYPLALNRCQQCGHGQLTHSVSPDILYKNYAYVSGTSRTLDNYFEWFADECADLLPPGSSVLEIACNDGSLLRKLDGRGLFTFGVDPATNITSNVTGVRIKNALWPCELPVGPYGSYDMVVAMNALAHGPDPLAFMKGIRSVLAPDGVCVIQTSQGKMLAGAEFDTIYHEHHSFFTVSSMAWLASRAGLRLRTVREVSVHGGSYCWILDRPEDTEKSADLNFLTTGEFAVSGEIAKFGCSGDYAMFSSNVRRKLSNIREIVQSNQEAGTPVAFVGYAAKAAVVLHATGIIPDHVYDEADLKIGGWIPCAGKQIQPLSEISKLPDNALVVIGAWNYRNELETKVRAYRVGKATRFIVYMPDVAEWS